MTLFSSSYQFGLKPHSSTVLCSALFIETIEHYVHNARQPAYVLLLDACVIYLIIHFVYIYIYIYTHIYIIIYIYKYIYIYIYILGLGCHVGPIYLLDPLDMLMMSH